MDEIAEEHDDVMRHDRAARTAPVLGLLLPADPERPVQVLLVPHSSAGFSDAIGGGLLDDALTGTCEGGRFCVYLDAERETKTLTSNHRTAVLLTRLGHPEPAALAGLRGDALIVGIDARNGDCDIPAGVLVAACQTQPQVTVDVNLDASVCVL